MSESGYVEPVRPHAPDEELHAALFKLQQWGMVRPGWQARWNGSLGTYVYAFTTLSREAKALTEAELEKYLEGVRDSRRYLAHHWGYTITD